PRREQPAEDGRPADQARVPPPVPDPQLPRQQCDLDRDRGEVPVAAADEPVDGGGAEVGEGVAEVVGGDRAVPLVDAVGQPDEQLFLMLFGVGAPLAGFLVALVTIFVPRTSPVTAPIYAVLEGLFLGAVSRFVNERYAGIVIEAAALTAGVLGAMAVLYATRW